MNEYFNQSLKNKLKFPLRHRDIKRAIYHPSRGPNRINDGRFLAEGKTKDSKKRRPVLSVRGRIDLS